MRPRGGRARDVIATPRAITSADASSAALSDRPRRPSRDVIAPNERTGIVGPREDGPQEQTRAGRWGRRRTWDTGRDALATMA